MLTSFLFSTSTAELAALRLRFRDLKITSQQLDIVELLESVFFCIA